MSCIFTNGATNHQKECLTCLDVQKLQCFLNHPFKQVSEPGQKELKKQLTEQINDKQRKD